MGSKKNKSNDIYFKSKKQKKKNQGGAGQSGEKAAKVQVATLQGQSDVPFLFDASWLFIIYFGIIFRNHVQPQWWYDIQAGKSYPGYYDHFFIIMRSINARMQMPDNRPLHWRLFFVCMHNIVPAFYGLVVYQQQGITPEFKNSLCYLVGFTAFYTRLLTYVPRKSLLKFKELILIGQAEQACVFTMMIINSVNCLHDPGFANGDLLTAIIIALSIIHIRQGSIYVEELLLGGVGGFDAGSIPPNYFSHFSAFAALYYFANKSLGFPIELVVPQLEKCQQGAWTRLQDSECRIRISGWERAIHYDNPDDLIVYDALNIAIMVWFYYGAVNSIRGMRSKSQAGNIKAKKIKSD